MNESTRSVCEHVVDAVAREKDSDPQTLPPLHDAVATDALDALYERKGGPKGDEAAPTVTFHYAGHVVRVRSAADIEVRPEAAESTP
jgi:hypothetical protein